MAFLPSAFDASAVEPSAPMEIIPPGDYPAQIVESEMKPTSAGTGQYLALTWEVTDGEHKGRKLWSNLNLDNPNATAVDIARRDFSAICHAAGVLNVTDSEQLHWKPITLSVSVLPAGHKSRSGYVNEKAKNEVKGYSALNAARPAAPEARPVVAASRPQPAPAARPAAGPQSAPWRRAG